MDLNNNEWKHIRQFFSVPSGREDGKGRPRASDREILNGILWILRTGAPWKELPAKYPARSSCHRRFQTWAQDGSFERAWRRLVRLLDRKGRIDWAEGFIDGSFASAKKGGKRLERRNVEKERSGWPSLTGMVSRSD